MECIPVYNVAWSVFKCSYCFLTMTLTNLSSPYTHEHCALLFHMNKMKRPHYLLIPLCVLRSSTYLFISVCYTGSVEGPHHGETPEISSQWAPTHIKFNFCTGSALLVIVMYDDILIRCLLFFSPSSPPTQGASSNINLHIQDQPHSSGRGNRAGRRRHHHHRQPDQSQNTIQQILHPGNLLRRLLPSSSQFNPGSHTSWTRIL